MLLNQLGKPVSIPLPVTNTVSSGLSFDLVASVMELQFQRWMNDSNAGTVASKIRARNLE